jgi:dihydrofolate synthase / folylpolyglutamate synthase
MRYQAAIETLFGLQARGMRMGIERMQQALAHRAIVPAALPPMILVAGTNGKGSVAAMLSSVLCAAGYRVGLFTSPHLHRFTERVRIQGEPLGIREATRRIEDLLNVFGAPGAPFVSFFELSTLLAVEAFRDARCDVAVMEVGLGGRLDATNALPAVLCVITGIGLDHMQYLGDSIAQIAAEKAGIIRPGVPVIVGARAPEALRVISAIARRQRAPLRRIERDFRAVVPRGVHARAGLAKIGFRVGDARYAPVQLGLAGQHQRDNAAVAVAALAELAGRGFAIGKRAIARGLASVRWPARLEVLPARAHGRARHLLDAAHNPDGCVALADHLSRERRRPRVLVFGVMADKDFPLMLRTLAPQVEHVIYAAPKLPRAQTLPELCAVLPGEQARDIADALRRARRAAGTKGLVIVAGSIFLVAEARARLLHVPTDPLIRL